MLVTKPPMGWNSWNTFGRDISEDLILQTADAMVRFGFRDAGYEYVVIDDCWAEKQRTPITGGKKDVPAASTESIAHPVIQQFSVRRLR